MPDRKRPERPRRQARSARTSAEVQPIAWPSETFRELYDEAPVPYLTTDEHGMIRALNRRTSELLGVERHQALGFPLRAFVAQTDWGDLAAHLERLRADGRAVGELTLRSSRGTEIVVRLESQRSSGALGPCWTAVFDLSDSRRATTEHARLHVAEKAARDANMVKDRFIAVLSHELRAPLAPLLAAVPALEASATASPEKLAQVAQLLKRNVLREARLIDDLLDVSRIASGKVELRHAPTDLHAIARESLEMVAPEAVARRQVLMVSLDAGRHHVDGDTARLRQVFSNLLKNAVKFTPEGGHIGVRSWNHEGVVVVEVSDDGMGIEPAALARIFDSFEQVGAAGSGGGLGLGLAIARGMIELHGGKISAHSAGLRRGARFLVELPALKGAVEARPAAATPRRPPRRAGRDQEILIVEDEPDLADTLVAVLESEGYRARAVATASAALAVDLDRIGVVISDLGLPDLDGRVLIERLKAKRDFKAIALSGYGTEADVQASEAAGFDQHLTKPVEMGVLLGAIDRVCAR
ncbi:MAG TPA: ATP-binding protein [Polyangia bacterium]|nr:ATP-binding protein [Polyangia bacterium]